MSVPVETSFASASYSTSYNELLESKRCLINSLTMINTDSSTGITITGGKIDNISIVSDPSDAVNKNYVIGSKRPSGPTDSVQFNDHGVFNGSSKLLFNGNFNSGTLILSDTAISDSVIVIGSNSISNAPEPIYGSQLATKNYVDRYRNLTTSLTYNSSASVTYSSLANTLILRSNIVESSSTITDLVPSAQNIIKSLMLTDISVNAASVSSLTLFGTQVVDGVTLLQNDLVLAKDQVNLVSNGIYTVKSSAWIRTSSLAPSAFGKRIYVDGGSTNGYLMYMSANNVSKSIVGTNDLTFTTINVLPTMSYYSFDVINKSLDSTFIISSNTGTTFTRSDPVVLYPTYNMNSVAYVTSIVPPTVSIDITHNGPNVKYLSSNFTNGTFQTNLSYKIDNTFMIPGPSTYISNTSVGYSYVQADVSKNIIVRNPGSASLDGFDNLLTQSIFTIQNISGFSITLSGTNSTGTWVFTPNPIIITATKTCDVLLYNNAGINYAMSMGNKQF